MREHSEWNDPANIGPKRVDFAKMPPRNPHVLSTWALKTAVAMIEQYDADADANAGDVLEDLRALCADTLLHVGEVAAMRER
jgi:hypothetical protein